jgi:large subunit ribosomal protein L30
MLKITLKRSYIGKPEKIKRVLRALGLRKIGHTVLKPDEPSVRGMLQKVSHMVEVQKVEEQGGG